MKIEISDDKSSAKIDGIEYELKQIPKPKYEVWKPKEYDIVFFNDINSKPIKVGYKSIYPNYRLYKTEAEAIEAHEKAMFNYEVEMFIKEKNEGWIPDWTDFMQIKCSLCVNYYKGQEILINEGTYVCISGQQKHFKSKEIGKEIIAKFDNEKLVKYWI